MKINVEVLKKSESQEARSRSEWARWRPGNAIRLWVQGRRV